MEKVFWWALEEDRDNAALMYVGDHGGAVELFPVTPKAVASFLNEGYREISWRTAKAMGAPY